MPGIRTSVFSSACALMMLAAIALPAGCISRSVTLDELEQPQQLSVVVDSNCVTVTPGRRVKFYVDIVNRASTLLNLEGLSIELVASPLGDPSTVALRKTFSYRWNQRIRLRPQKKITVPIVPESRKTDSPELGRAVTISEFPLGSLAPGKYEIRAVVQDRFVSLPYRLKVHRPDLARRPMR